MGNGDNDTKKGNASLHLKYAEERNEREAQHHDENSQTLRLVRVTLLLLVLFSLVGLLIYAFEQLEEKSYKLANRSVDKHFYKTVSYELSANHRFERAAAKMCKLMSAKGGQRSEYAKKAYELGAELTAQWLESVGNTDASEDEVAFAEMIYSLPDEKKAAWDHFVSQIKKDREATIRYIEQECEADVEGSLGLRNK